ncbi:Trm112 family protein [Balneola vulgaris]|uniref:Trm112 family protein n=1 Tax=Balneola vulgaris TaxID=287535 RepID=UPI00036EC9FF|nr:Trm112 family protein [Balneola vulgaris]
MQKQLLKKLCCPIDKSDLEVQIFTEQEDEILEALMTCPECNRFFPVIYGLPILIPDEYRDFDMEGEVLTRWGFILDEKSETPQLLPEASTTE